MAYETKVILKALANQVAMAKNLKQAYSLIADAANAEGLDLPSYEETRLKIEKLEQPEEPKND